MVEVDSIIISKIEGDLNDKTCDFVIFSTKFKDAKLSLKTAFDCAAVMQMSFVLHGSDARLTKS